MAVEAVLITVLLFGFELRDGHGGQRAMHRRQSRPCRNQAGPPSARVEQAFILLNSLGPEDPGDPVPRIS